MGLTQHPFLVVSIIAEHILRCMDDEVTERGRNLSDFQDYP